MNAPTATAYIPRPGVKGRGFVILLQRHVAPQPETWGVHEVFLREATDNDPHNAHDNAYRALLGTRAPRFTQANARLFPTKPELQLQGWHLLTAQSIILASADKPVGVGLVATNEFNALMDYIGEEIVPFEWRDRWQTKDASVRRRVEVWV